LKSPKSQYCPKCVFGKSGERDFTLQNYAKDVPNLEISHCRKKYNVHLRKSKLFCDRGPVVFAPRTQTDATGLNEYSQGESFFFVQDVTIMCR
jgi:hypothetical protein